MKLVRFQTVGDPRLGSLHGDRIIDLTLAYEAMLQDSNRVKARERAAVMVPPDMEDFLAGEDEAMDLAASLSVKRDLPLVAYAVEGPGTPFLDVEVDVAVPAARYCTRRQAPIRVVRVPVIADFTGRRIEDAVAAAVC